MSIREGDTYYIDQSGKDMKVYLDPEYKFPTCEECDGRGIFYFTKDERLQDSQPCGECHGKGWIYDER